MRSRLLVDWIVRVSPEGKEGGGAICLRVRNGGEGMGNEREGCQTEVPCILRHSVGVLCQH